MLVAIILVLKKAYERVVVWEKGIILGIHFRPARVRHWERERRPLSVCYIFYVFKVCKL